MTKPDNLDVLIVEDNPDDVELTLRAFKQARLTTAVQVVRDGVEALELLLGEEGAPPPGLPRVVLLDLKLPKVNGLETLEKIRANERTKRLPVVIVTSSREEPDVRRAYELGANSYIVKPVEFEKFVSDIGDVGRYWLRLNQAPS